MNSKIILFLFLLITPFAIVAGDYRHPIGPFTSIATKGNFSIHIRDGRRPYVQMSETAIPYVDVWVEGGILHLDNVDKDNPSKKTSTFYPVTTVNISISHLEGLYLCGNTSVTGSNIHSNGLIIDTKDNSFVSLTGVMNVKCINAHDNSNVTVRWINSNNLMVEGHDSAQICLGGVAQMLEARVWDQSHLDARFLRPHIALVQSWNSAIADVLAINGLYAFATDNSNVYYFKTPHYAFQHSEASGNVLQLGRWK